MIDHWFIYDLFRGLPFLSFTQPNLSSMLATHVVLKNNLVPKTLFSHLGVPRERKGSWDPSCFKGKVMFQNFQPSSLYSETSIRFLSGSLKYTDVIGPLAPVLFTGPSSTIISKLSKFFTTL